MRRSLQSHLHQVADHHHQLDLETVHSQSAFLLATLPSPVQAAGVPTVPGSDGLVRSPEEALKVAKEVQHPSYPALQTQAPKDEATHCCCSHVIS